VAATVLPTVRQIAAPVVRCSNPPCARANIDFGTSTLNVLHRARAIRRCAAALPITP
jgi:hypothetical protein